MAIDLRIHRGTVLNASWSRTRCLLREPFGLAGELSLHVNAEARPTPFNGDMKR